MNALSKLSNKIKILILVLYTIVALVIAILIINSQTTSKLFESYGSKSYDENLKICFRLKETRKSSYQTAKDYEETTYELYASLEKQDEAKQKAIEKINFYISGETTKGKLVFDEGLRKGTISSGSSTYSTNYNLCTNTSFVKKFVVVDEKETLKDQEPAKLYFKITYTIKGTEKEEKKEINYFTTVSKIEKINFDSFEKYEVEAGVIKENEAPYKLTIKKSLATEQTTAGNVKYDGIKTSLALDVPNLKERIIDLAKIEIFVKVKNDKSDKDNNFSDYVRVYGFYGSVISISNSETTFDEAYDISDLYVISNISFSDGTSYSTKYKLNLSDITTY